MKITASMVKELREMTGAGMMDCKKALNAVDGDMDKAVEFLRENGMAKAAKKAGRIAAEGICMIAGDDKKAAVVEVNSETDFVAKNEKFIEFAKGVAATVAKENPADLEALLACKYNGTDLTVEQQQQEMVLVIGENIKVRRFARYDSGMNVPYVHMGGRIGVIVNLDVSEGLESNETVQELAKDIAMQIAALNPAYLDKETVPAEVVEHEKSIMMVQINEDPKNASKPDAIKEKMIIGKINKYYTEVCLMQQPFVKDDKVSVEKHVAEVAKQVGGTIKVNAYTRFERGEGIEKKQDNFAEEIASMVAGK